MFKWIREKISNTGKSTLDVSKKLTGFEDISKNTVEMKKMAQTVLLPTETIKNSRKETFKEAMQRQGVNDIDLVKVYHNYALIFYASIGFSLFCLLFTFYKLFIKSDVFSAFSMVVIMSFCLANAFKFSFRAFQIKHQKLCSVNEWWNRSDEWFPKIK
jgi:hypothetical protein